MRGSVVNRNGHYSVVLDLGKDPVTGKRKQQWVVVKGNSKDADKKLRELMTQLDKGMYVRPGKVTVREHILNWIEGYVVPNLESSTAETYRFMAKKHIFPKLGNIELALLRPQDIQSLYSDKIKSGKSSATVRKIHNVLHKSLENALKTGLIVRNPLDGVECPKLKQREMTTMNETDIHIILDRARDTDYYPLWYTLLFTGARRSEVLALKWGDVDLILLKVSVNRSLTYLNSGKKGERILLKSPKTKKSRRFISITPSNAIVLREHSQKRNEIRQSVGLPPLRDEDFVFATFDGKPYLPNSITHAWIKLVRKCGLPGRRLHDCRHSYASILLRQNVHPSIVANQLGHASVKTTLDLYSHAIPALQDEAALKFDKMVVG